MKKRRFAEEQMVKILGEVNQTPIGCGLMITADELAR